MRMTELPLYRILKDETRQKIIRLIGDMGNSSYTDILTQLNLSTGKLNYHLKILAPFLLKSGDGYSLSEMGESAYSNLTKSHTIQNGNDRFYRSLSWVLVPLSLIFILVSNIYIQISGMAILFAGIFFYFNSGTTKMRTWELLVVLSIGLVAGSFGALTQIVVYYPSRFTLGVLYSHLITSIYSIVYFATFVAWALTTTGRWILTVLVMSSISLFFFATLIYSAYHPFGSYTGWTTLGVVFPIPSIFLIVTALSEAVIMLNARSLKISSS